MELRQVEYFLVACKMLNFTRAAEKCDVAVPTLTRAIKALEEELGGQLFRRERHLTHLTDLGRLMQTHLAQAKEATVKALSEAERMRLCDGRLRLGVVTTMGARQLVRLLSTIRRKVPSLDLQLWDANCEELQNALLNGELDLAITTDFKVGDRLRLAKLYEERYFVSFPKGHRFERMDAVPLKEIDGEAYIQRLHCEFPGDLVEAGIKPPYRGVDTRFYGEREDWIQMLVVSGLGIALMPEFLPIIPGLLTRPVIEPAISRPVSLMTVAARSHTSAVAQVIQTAQSIDWYAEPEAVPSS